MRRAAWHFKASPSFLAAPPEEGLLSGLSPANGVFLFLLLTRANRSAGEAREMAGPELQGSALLPGSNLTLDPTPWVSDPSITSFLYIPNYHRGNTTFQTSGPSPQDQGES